MAKVYVSPACHRWNPCAISGCDETTHNNLLCDELVPFLTASGINVKRGPRRVPKSDEDGDQLMINAVAESNAWGADVHYISHTNAFNGSTRYSMTMYYPGSFEGRKLAVMMRENKRSLYPGDCIIKERGDLYELRATYCPAVYQEHCFHDVLSDAQWFHNNLREIARRDAQVLCQYLGVEFVDPYSGGGEPDPERPQIDEDGVWGFDTTLATQIKLGVQYRDGVLSNQYSGNLGACILESAINYNGWDFVNVLSSIGSDTVRAIQRLVGANVDGVLGPDTIRHMQKFLNISEDSVLGYDTVSAWQRWLNAA